MDNIASNASIAQKIYRYVLDNPRCKRSDIAAFLGLSVSTTSNYLTRMHEAGKIARHDNKGCRRNGVLWEVGGEDSIDSKIGVPQQTTVSTWAPCTLRDPLTAALFGMGSAERGNK